jgi:septal ring factor EnvC (AmiA/AmiB activator)
MTTHGNDVSYLSRRVKLSDDSRVKTEQSVADHQTSEDHVKQLTAEFVASKTQPMPQISETARNLLRVATGKDNDPVAVERAIKELKRFRHEPLVEEFFAARERVEDGKLFAARIIALKNSGLVKKIGGDNV